MNVQAAAQSQRNKIMKAPKNYGAGDVASHGLLAVARVIPHPWKTGETRNIYEFPVTRKIIVEADPSTPESEILAMAKRCNDREIGLKITGGRYELSLSPANA